MFQANLVWIVILVGQYLTPGANARMKECKNRQHASGGQPVFCKKFFVHTKELLLTTESVIVIIKL